ncbi:hypothetical protein Tco_0423631, partial [Tanacetum coccineum]
SCVYDDLPIYGYDRNDVERLCAPEVGSRATKVEQVEGLDDASDFWVDLENSLGKTDSTPARAVSAPTSYLGKRLGPPPSLSFVVVFEPLQICGSVNASTSGHDFAQKVLSGYAEVLFHFLSFCTFSLKFRYW